MPGFIPFDDPKIENTEPQAVLTDAVKQFDLIHTTLLGLVGIVLLLYAAALLPVFGLQPIESGVAALEIGVAMVIGIVGLYSMNFRVHKHVTEQARLTEALVNSLGQGFLTFNAKGICGRVYSQACLDLLETSPAGKTLASVLRVPENAVEDFQGWIDVLFDPTHALGFDDAVRFLPDSFPHGQGKKITLMYRPIRDKREKLVDVVVIATDRSGEVAAQELAERRQQFAEMICKISRERNQFMTTIAHIRDFLRDSGRSEVGLDDAAGVMRQLHTIKGAVRHFNLLSFGNVVHECETLLRVQDIKGDAEFRAALQQIRPRVEAELALALEDVKDIVDVEEQKLGNFYEISEQAIYDFVGWMNERNADRDIVRAYLSRIAALPIHTVLTSFGRELQDLALQFDKQIKPVVFRGVNHKILVQPMSNFLFSLTHISRNIIDHGIESPVTRMARGKDPEGTVIVHTQVMREGGQDGKQWLEISISDDGAGIDPSRIRQKLATLEPEGDWRFEDDQAVIQRIFTWGFSTRDGVSQTSGRGVGLEAVWREVNILGGSIRVVSEIYKGARFEIRVPYLTDIVR